MKQRIDETIDAAVAAEASHLQSMWGWTWRQDDGGAWEACVESTGSEADVALDERIAGRMRLVDAVHRARKTAPDDVFLIDGLLAPLGAFAFMGAVVDELPNDLRDAAKRAAFRDRPAKFTNEIAALAAWFYGQRHGDASANAWTRSSMGRMLDRARMAAPAKGCGATVLCHCGRTRAEHPKFGQRGAADECETFRPMLMHVGSSAAPTSAKPSGPNVDITLRSIGRVVGRITETLDVERDDVVDTRLGPMRTGKKRIEKIPARLLLLEAYVALRDPNGLERSSATVIAEEVRVQGSPAPEWSSTKGGPAFRWPVLVAELHALDPAIWSKRIAAIVRRARKFLRDELAKIELDSGAKWMIPPPTTAEMRAEAARGERIAVECCAGPRVVDGLLEPCEPIPVDGPTDSHPSASWPLCEACERPIKFARKVAA